MASDWSTVAAAPSADGMREPHEAVGFREGQRLEQDAVHEAEHGRRRADAERQHENDRYCKAGRASKAARRESKLRPGREHPSEVVAAAIFLRQTRFSTRARWHIQHVGHVSRQTRGLGPLCPDDCATRVMPCGAACALITLDTWWPFRHSPIDKRWKKADSLSSCRARSIF